MKAAYQLTGIYETAAENTFIVISKETNEAVAELSDRLASKINTEKYLCMRPSEYLPTLNQKAAFFLDIPVGAC